MAQIKSVSLEGQVNDIGNVHFLRAEWRRAASRFALIRYAVDGQERDLGVVLDLDKKVILDDLALTSRVPAADLRNRTEAIWRIVARARANDIAFGGPNTD